MKTLRKHINIILSTGLGMIALFSGCSPTARQMPVTPSTEAATLGVTQTPTLAQMPLATETPGAPTAVIANDQDCQTPTMSTYTSSDGDYCFAYPEQFRLEPSPDDGVPALSGPALDQGPEALRASMHIEVQLVGEEASMEALVNAYLSQTFIQASPAPIQRTQINLGGEPAAVLEDVPGLLSSRIVMALHAGHLYTLRFHPSDAPLAETDLEELYAVVRDSFRFLPGGIATPHSAPHIMNWVEHEHTIQMSIDPSVALWVEADSIPAVPVDPSIMFAESLPAAAQFRLLGYHGGQRFLLPYPFAEPRVNFYATKDFPGYGDDLPIGFPQTLARLRVLLAEAPELSMCASLPNGDIPLVPFLPWLNSAQVFCSHPEYLEYNGGKGIRYVSAFSQEIAPPTDDRIFYTFQGLSDDGEIYLSAVFPVRTGVFPTQPDPDFDMQTWLEFLQNRLGQLQSISRDSFDPPLDELDDLVQGITVGKP